MEKTLKNIYSTLKNQKGSLLIITTDHWWRSEYRNSNHKDKAFPVVFISKIIGDDVKLKSSKAANSTGIKDLIIKRRKNTEF